MAVTFIEQFVSEKKISKFYFKYKDGYFYWSFLSEDDNMITIILKEAVPFLFVPQLINKIKERPETLKGVIIHV